MKDEDVNGNGIGNQSSWTGHWEFVGSVSKYVERAGVFSGRHQGRNKTHERTYHQHQRHEREQNSTEGYEQQATRDRSHYRKTNQSRTSEQANETNESTLPINESKKGLHQKHIARIEIISREIGVCSKSGSGKTRNVQTDVPQQTKSTDCKELCRA